MPYELPASIRARVNASAPVAHAWDDWDPYPVVGDADAELCDKLSDVTDRAQIAFAIGCAEWLVARLAGLIDDDRPRLFLESAWAHQMSDEFAMPPQFRDEEWQGPVRAAIDLALITINNTSYGTEDGTGAADASFAAKLARHVLTDAAPFDEWVAGTVAALQRDCSREDDPIGEPIPPAALAAGPAGAAAPKSTWPDEVKAYLAGLDPAKNPFLGPLGKR